MVRAAIGLIVWVLLASVAHAEKRIALLISNQGYSGEIGRLANPHNDVVLLEKALKDLHFEVTTVRDAGLAALHQAVNAHARRVGAAGPSAVGFFYYSGHGAADGSTNYLIPVDVNTAETGELWDQSLQLTEITRKLRRGAGNATHFVVFDACRNTLKMRQTGSRALVQSKGFVPVSQESGMLIAYATAEGELASDVGAGAGPYAKVLAEEIVKPGVESVAMFRVVQRRVRAAISQEPYLGFNALGDVYLAGSETPKLPPVAAPQTQPEPARLSEAAEAWDRTKDTTNVSILEVFIGRYKDTFYADLARARLEEVKKQQVAVAAPPKAPQPVTPSPLQPAVAVTPSAPSTHCDGVLKLVGNEKLCLKSGSGKTESFKDCPLCPEMVVVPAGSFTMGSPKNEEGRSNNEDPQHKVTIRAAFAVGRFAVTFAEWDACVAAGGCMHKPEDVGWGRGKRPVINVSWDDTKAYVEWLSKTTGKTYRLLSEAEREYVTRAGTTTPFWLGSTISPSQGNYDGNYTYGGGAKGEYRHKTMPVDSFEPNPWRLYQVHGNVWEWVEDCWHANYQGAPADGSAWVTSCTEGSRRVLRGGSWYDYPQFLRAANRLGYTTGYRLFYSGFRLARALSP
jgi:formylglycine-generating enzyme required for sulfatase activity